MFVKKIKFEFLRPKRLSGDKVRTMAVINHVVKKFEKMGEYYDEVWIVYPCSPLMEIQDYKKISKLLKRFNYKKTVLTVCEYPAPIEVSYKIKMNNFLMPNKKSNFFKRTQDFKKFFYETGAVVAIPKKNFSDIKDRPNFNNLVPYIVERHKSIDINTLRDWNLQRWFIIQLSSYDFNKKTILITGGTGSFGQKFIETVVKRYKPKK